MMTPEVDFSYQIDDRYTRRAGRVYLNGSQALVLLPMLQRERDQKAGLNTAGFISGYTGSPLGGYDIALKQAAAHLKNHHVYFRPGVNEDLAATSVWGSQQVTMMPGASYDGVFSLWYGKGPGVDRSGDALKHGSYAGASENGGTLVLAGDDHGAKSSTTAHQSDQAFMHFGMPYFNPADVQDYLDFGLYGFALSRYSGCWVGMKCVTDTIESSASVSIEPDRVAVRIPVDFDMPESGLNLRWGITPLEQESRQKIRLRAAQAFVRANGLNREVISSPNGILGIVTSGKAYLDLRQALDELGLDEQRCRELGVSVLKAGMPWPLEPQHFSDFCLRHSEILVIEEKAPVMEDQLARLLYGAERRPRLTGKTDGAGVTLLPDTGELDPLTVTRALMQRLQALGLFDYDLQRRSQELDQGLTASGAPSGPVRMPAFCAGCPHNTSTNVPAGSYAFGGIGCHGMAVWLPERRTLSLTHMGGEGAPWLGIAPFTETPHLFQNLGDGTYYHSGLLAIRAAAAAGVNITYKILVNDAIAMTGGQSIEGQVGVDALSFQVYAEGARRIALVTDKPEQYRARKAEFAPGVTIHHRDELDAVQRDFRDVKGLSVIIYQQYCATELRRRRKRGTAENPDKRLFIHPLVCEGCGDCGVQSNCIAIEPIETEFGRKRRINQSSCNKDYSCQKGYCPSFVSVYGATPRKRQARGDNRIHARAAALPTPAVANTEAPYNILITGIGGYGVITLGALLGMAAHLEGKGCSVLDVAGLAQRNGAVTSHVRIAGQADQLHASRIARGSADLLLGSDIVVSASPDALSKYRTDRTRGLVNTFVAPTSAFASQPDMNLSPEAMMAVIADSVSGECEFIDAHSIAYSLLGDAVGANLFLMGYAAQKGWLPVSLEAFERAIELNGVSVEMNKTAIAWGRLAAVNLAEVEAAAEVNPQQEDHEEATEEDLEALITVREEFLTQYQDATYARRYRDFVDHVRRVEERELGGRSELTRTVARYLFKLMAYKDEYEVARLFTEFDVRQYLDREFEGDYRVEFNMAPPLLGRRDPRTGRYPKIQLGPWMRPVFVVLAKLRFLRGTAFDFFGKSEHRRRERLLIDQYRTTVEGVLAKLSPHNYELALEIASVPEMIRGYDIVKERHIEQAAKHEKGLLDRYHGRAVHQYDPENSELIETVQLEG